MNLQERTEQPLSKNELEEIRNRPSDVPEGETTNGVRVTLDLECDVHEKYFFSFHSDRQINAQNEGHDVFMQYLCENANELVNKSDLQWFESHSNYTMTTVVVQSSTRDEFDSTLEELQEQTNGTPIPVLMSALVSAGLSQWEEVF